MRGPRDIFAPAKINLGLRVTGRYATGYHRLDTVFVPVSLFDRLNLQEAACDSVTHLWPAESAPATRRHLAQGAAANPLIQKTLAFLRRYIQLPHLKIEVAKRIPSPGGLGGASADAAALMRALWQEQRAGEKMPGTLIQASEALGADIPFFLRYGLEGHAARLKGVGHELTWVDIPPLCGWLSVPAFGFPTAQMFAEVRRWDLPLAEEGSVENSGTSESNLALRLNEIPYSDEPIDGVRFVKNDFDTAAAAVFPAEHKRLERAKRTIAQTAAQFFPGAWVIGMTGSGAGLFAATDAVLPKRGLSAYAGVLRARLGAGWQVFPFQSFLKSRGC